MLLIVLAGSSYTVAARTAVALPAQASGETDEPELLNIDPTNFDHSAVIDNDWMPLKPGTRLFYEGVDVDDNGDRIPHVVVVTVTDLTKVIDGVRTRITLEEDYSDEELVEQDAIFHAQDKDGNVWHLGELVETYEEGSLVGGQVWLVGLTEGAHAGIEMLAEPQVGDIYSQGYAPPPYYWTDRAEVYQTGQQTTVPAGSYEDVMVIAEWDRETEEGVFQDKYHARGVGVVRVGFRGPDPQKEELELGGIEQLGEVELADVRTQVLQMEERAYAYGRTPPAEKG
ncbi:MAG: hypothetical protein ACJ789_20820 [Thermomicrobiales bacterium]